MEKLRVQKILADAGYCSRRRAEALIEAGKVKCNGHPVRIGDKALPTDLLTVDGERVFIPRKKEFRYIMLNKPRGYVTTLSDEQGRRCVTDLLEGVSERVYPVGRQRRDHVQTVHSRREGKRREVGAARDCRGKHVRKAGLCRQTQFPQRRLLRAPDVEVDEQRAAARLRECDGKGRRSNRLALARARGDDQQAVSKRLVMRRVKQMPQPADALRKLGGGIVPKEPHGISAHA